MAVSAKVKIIWSPDGGSRKEWVLDLVRPGWDVLYDSETETGWTWGEFTQKIQLRSVIAWRVLIWTLRKRDGERVSLESMRLDFDEYEIGEVPDAPTEVEDPKADV